MVKNLPPDAGDTGLIPSQGTKIPHATEQPSLLATTTEPTSNSLATVSPRAATQATKIQHNQMHK